MKFTDEQTCPERSVALSLSKGRRTVYQRQDRLNPPALRLRSLELHLVAPLRAVKFSSQKHLLRRAGLRGSGLESRASTRGRTRAPTATPAS